MRRTLISMLFLATPAAALAQVASPQTDPAAVVRAYVAAQNSRDIDGMLALVADRVEMRSGLTSARIAQSTFSEDQTQLRARFRQITENVPLARSEILQIMAQGNLVITKERMSGLPGGGFDIGIAMYHVRSGKIESIWLVSSAPASGDDR